MKMLALFLLAPLLSCNTPGSPVAEVTGTWGGNDAGLIVNDVTTHLHIGCTSGDIPGAIRPDAAGNFSVTGTYNINAYPIDLGIRHPARFSGNTRGRLLTVTVTLTDTAVTRGPATVTFGVEPRMGPCPICRVPQRPRAREMP